MRVKIAGAMLFLASMAVGLSALTSEVRASHSCPEKDGCEPGTPTHENGWDVCTYVCNWQPLPPP